MTTERRLIASVVVVTKDRPQMIRNLLESLTGQSLPPDEVLVVDNNSCCSYAAVFQEFKDRLPLRAVVETVPGIPAARNRGIRESSGDIILFTDDDCVADPRWVENMVQPFYRNPYIGAVGGPLRSVNKASSLVQEFYASERS